MKHREFHLPDKFLNSLSSKFGPLGESIHKDKYARYKPNGEKETWSETVERVVEGNCSLVNHKYIAPNEKELLKQIIEGMVFIPGGRQLWTMGVPSRTWPFNCHVAGWDEENPYEHFGFTFSALMQGGGVGANYSNEFINKVPPIKQEVDLHIVCSSSHPNYKEVKKYCSREYSPNWDFSHVVADTREGWVEALKLLLNAFWGLSYPILVIDVSNIRERGRRLKLFGGTASGPLPLVEMLISIWDFLSTIYSKYRTSSASNKLTSTDVMTIDHYMAICVVSGNIRRSSRIAIKIWSDPDILDFINCKAEETAHWTANISVAYDNEYIQLLCANDPHAVKVHRAVCEGMLRNGDPGYWNEELSNTDEPTRIVSPNPCGEIPLPEWGNCNIGHGNLRYAYGREVEMQTCFSLISRFLLRSTYADVPSKNQRIACDRDRRIGVGFMGYADWCALSGLKYSASYNSQYIIQTLRQWAVAIESTANEYAHMLRIPRPVKYRTIAPNGTGSYLPGVTPGCQAVKYRYFKRRVRYDNDEPTVKEAIENGLHVEPAINEPHTSIVTYVMKDSLVDFMERMCKCSSNVIEEEEDIPLYAKLSVQTMLQRVWADNAITYTAMVPKDTKCDDLEHQIKIFLPYLKGTTVMVDKTRSQQPIEKCTKEEWEESAGMIGGAGASCKNDVCER